jgi:hypothetical protein
MSDKTPLSCPYCGSEIVSSTGFEDVPWMCHSCDFNDSGDPTEWHEDDPSVKRIRALEAELAKAERELTAIHNSNTDNLVSGLGWQQRAETAEQRFKILAEDTSQGFECLPDCDSYGHNEQCPVANPLEAWKQLRAELAAAKADNVDLRDWLERLGVLASGGQIDNAPPEEEGKGNES